MKTLLTSFVLIFAAAPGLGQVNDWLVAADTLNPKSWFNKQEVPPPGEPPRDPPEYPFDRKHIEQYCKHLFYGGEPNTRFFSHSFNLKYSSGLSYIEVSGTDQLLGITVNLYFADHQRTKLSRCIALCEGKSYVANDIFQVSLSPKKRLFMISFKECETILVIYISKEHPAVAFWTLPKE